VTRG